MTGAPMGAAISSTSSMGKAWDSWEVIDAFWAWPGWGAAARARGLLPWAGAPA